MSDAKRIREFKRKYKALTGGIEACLEEGKPFKEYVDTNVNWFEEWSSETQLALGRLRAELLTDEEKYATHR